MNTKQVAEWLREAAASINYWSKGEGDRFKQRAAQVEAMTCDGCRWWCEIEGIATAPAGYGDCSCDKYVYDAEVNGRKDLLMYWDYEGYNAYFATGPKFGCIHWEKK